MSTERVQAPFYVVGTPHPNTHTHPNVSTKPSPVISERWTDGGITVRNDTGGGYERARSTEYRPHTSRRGKEDVYASIHRLCAVAWCFPDGTTAEDIDMAGMDVHHTTGVEWANFGDSPNFQDPDGVTGDGEVAKPGIEVLGHAEHSSVTQSQMRAWGEDAKRTVERGSEPDRCPECDAEPETWATSPAVDRYECLRCVTRKTDGGAIEVGR